ETARGEHGRTDAEPPRSERQAACGRALYPGSGEGSSMSAPARSLPSPIPKRADPSRTPAARPRATPSPHHRARARRGTPPFWVMTAVIVTAMVVGIVSLSALAGQARFRADDFRRLLVSVTPRPQSLVDDVAA